MFPNATSDPHTLPPAFALGVLDRSSTAIQPVASYEAPRRRPAARTARSRRFRGKNGGNLATGAEAPIFTLKPLQTSLPFTVATRSPSPPAKRRKVVIPATEALTSSPLRNCDPSTGATTTPVRDTGDSSIPRSQEPNHSFAPTTASDTLSAPVTSHYLLMSAVQAGQRDTAEGAWVTNDLPGGVFGLGSLLATQEQHLAAGNLDLNEDWTQFIQPQHLVVDKTGVPLMDPELAEALYLLDNRQFC